MYRCSWWVDHARCLGGTYWRPAYIFQLVLRALPYWQRYGQHNDFVSGNCWFRLINPIYNVFDHILETTNRVKDDLILKLAALLHDIGKPYKVVVVDNVDRFWGHEEMGANISRYVLTRLGYNQELITNVYNIIKFHDHKTFATIESVDDTVNLVGNDLVPYLFQLQRADLLSHSEKYYKVLLPKLNAAIKIYEDNIDAFNKEKKDPHKLDEN